MIINGKKIGKRNVIIATLGIFLFTSATAESLDFTANIIEAGTCDFKMSNTPSTSTFRIPINRFSGTGTVAQIFPINFQMSNCKNFTGTKTASIEVHGVESQVGNIQLFHTSGTATGIGIALRDGKYSKGDFGNSAQFIHSGMETYKSMTLGDKNIPFTAALISGVPKDQISQGDFTATISFDIKYN